GVAGLEYRAALPEGIPGSVSIALPMYVGEDYARAHRALERHLASRAAASEGFFEGAVRRGPSTLSAAAVARAGFSVFGPPDTVADALEEFERLGVDEVLGMFDIGDLPVPDVVQSMRRAATPRNHPIGMAP